MRSSIRFLLGVAAFAAVAACNDAPTVSGGREDVDAHAPLLDIVDGNRGGGSSGFYWLPPVVTAPPVSAGTFDNSVLNSLEVEVCELASIDCVAGGFRRVFTSAGASLTDRVRLISNSQYQLMYATAADNLDPAKMYRATVSAYGVKIGLVDIDVVSTLPELQSVDRSRYVGLYRGQTLPLSFRVDDLFPGACNTTSIDALVDAALAPALRPAFKSAVRQLVFLNRFAKAVDAQTARQVLLDQLRALVTASTTAPAITAINSLISGLYCATATALPGVTVSGTVVGTNGRGPASGVTVTVQPSGRSTVTAIDGTFAIAGVPLAIVTAAVSAPFPTGCAAAASQSDLAGAASFSFQLPCTSRPTIHWINSNGGNWSNQNNWSLGRVPNSGDDVFIDAAGTYTVTLDNNFTGQAIVVGSNTSRPTLSMLQKTLSVSDFLRIAPAAIVTGTQSTFAGTGNFEVQTGGTLKLYSSNVNLPLMNAGLFESIGTVSISQSFSTTNTSVFRTGANIGINASGVTTFANGFTNHGLIELTNVENTGSNTGLTVVGGPLMNATDGTIIAKQSQQISGRTLNADLINDGALTIDWPLTMSKANGVYVNRGSIAVTGSDLTMSGPVSSLQQSGVWTIGASRKVTITGNGNITSVVLQQGPNAPIIGGGTLQLTSARAQFNGVANELVLNSLVINSSNGAINSQLVTGVNTANLGALDMSQGTVTVVGGLNTANTSLRMFLARLNGTGTLANAAGRSITVRHTSYIDLPFTNAGELVAVGNLNVTQGFVTTPTSVVRTGANVGTGEIGPLTFANGFTNNGLIELTNVENGGSATGITVSNGALINATGATVLVKFSQQLSGRSLTADFVNDGLLDIQWSLLMPKTNATLVNRGTITVAGGDLTMQGPVTSIQQSGLLTIGATRKVSITGNGNNASVVLTQSPNSPIVGGGALLLTSARAQFNGNASNLVLNSLVVNSLNGAINSQLVTGVTTANLGALDVSQGTVTLEGGLNTATTSLRMFLARLNGTGSLYNAPGRTIAARHTSYIDLPFTNAGELTVVGNLNVTQTFATTSTSTIRTGATAGTGEIGPLTFANGFSNHGLIELTNTENAGTAVGIAVSNGTLVNATDGTIHVKQSQQISGRSVTGILLNSGLIRIDVPLLVTGSTTNDGRIEISRAASRMMTVSANFATSGTLAVALPSATFAGPPVIDAQRGQLSGTLELLSPPSPIGGTFSFLLVATVGCASNPCVAPLNGTFSSVTGPPGIPVSMQYDGIASARVRVF